MFSRVLKPIDYLKGGRGLDPSSNYRLDKLVGTPFAVVWLFQFLCDIVGQ